MILCYITDRNQLAGGLNSLQDKISEAMAASVDYIQLREKDLPARILEELTKQNQKLRIEFPASHLLINSRPDIAMAAGADGVHLPSHDISPQEVRRIWRGDTNPIVGVSCHSSVEVSCAAAAGADFAVFGPVFEKGDATPLGLDRLREACRNSIPVLALGGVTLKNATSCLEAGAAGIAAIRLFQGNRVADVVTALRGSAP